MLATVPGGIIIASSNQEPLSSRSGGETLNLGSETLLRQVNVSVTFPKVLEWVVRMKVLHFSQRLPCSGKNQQS